MTMLASPPVKPNDPLAEAAPAAIVAAPAPSAKPRAKFDKPDPAIVAKLRKLKEDRKLTNEVLGRMLGVHETRVSKYLNSQNTNDFDARPVSAAVEDVLKSEALRSDTAIELFDTFITTRIGGSYEMIRKTGDIGLIFASAGLGKSSSVQIESRQRPLTMAFAASKGNASASDVEGMIFDRIETKEWDRCSKRRKFIISRLADSRRLLLIDNAQRLGSDALKYVFDLHDETGIPVAFIGNPEVETVIRRNDQLFSRIGIKPDLRVWSDNTADAKKLVSDADMEAVADGILSRMIAQWHADIRDLALQVIWQQGHFRALRKTITLAHELAKDGGKLADPRRAFATAHGMLPRNYKLDGV